MKHSIELRHPSLGPGDMLTKSQRLVLGLLVLLFVNVIWVFSAEVTKHIYRDGQFEKPFFTTYFKTSMFSLYLLGLCFWPPWRDTCNRPPAYMFIDPNTEDENFYVDANTSLSDPTYVPVKTPDRERNSGTESDDSSIRSVRFNKLAEVRHMSEADATEALLARLSYQASVRAGEAARRAATKFPVFKVAQIAFTFCILWFITNYTYQVALTDAETGIATILISASNVFILILGGFFPANINDKFTLSKFIAVFISISGLILVNFSDFTKKSPQMPTGIVLALISALFYSAYLIFLRRNVDNEEKMDIPLFFGFVGLFNMTLLWPMFFLLHYSDLELFEWPNHDQWALIILNGLVGTVLSEALWLWGCFLTSSLIATISISLTIPMSMLADVIFKKASYPCMFYIGTVPMFLAFFAVPILTHYDNWDPCLEAVRWWYFFVCRKTRTLRIPDIESEQTEALIGINSMNDHEA